MARYSWARAPGAVGGARAGGGGASGSGVTALGSHVEVECGLSPKLEEDEGTG